MAPFAWRVKAFVDDLLNGSDAGTNGSRTGFRRCALWKPLCSLGRKNERSLSNATNDASREGAVNCQNQDSQVS